jgi:hypothetical protein
MADRHVLQVLAAEVVAFFEWAGEALTDPLARDALIRDLGGNPTGLPPLGPISSDRLNAVQAYRDAASPSTEDGINALADMAVLLDVVLTQAENWSDGFDAEDVDDLAHGLLDLLSTNYFRLRFPRLFLILQAVSTIEDVTSTYGPGNNSGSALGRSLWALLTYVAQPGKSLEQLGGVEGPGAGQAIADFFLTAGVITLAAVDMKVGIEVVEDVLTGWDGRGVDLDSPEPPFRSDAIAGRMSSVSFGARTTGPPSAGSLQGRLNLTTSFLHKVEGGPAVVVALGGNTAFERPLDRTWTYALKARLGDGVAAFIGRKEDAFEVAGPAGTDFELSAGVSANPRKPTSSEPAPPEVALSFPSRTGSRFDIGHLSLSIMATADGVETLVTVRDSALLIEAEEQDGVLVELLGNTPLRLPFAFVYGYSSKRGKVAEGSFGGAGTPPAPLSGKSSTGSSVADVHLPVARTIGPVTVHEVGLGFTLGPADAGPGEATEAALSIDASFSTRIGPVYFRVDRLGVAVKVDTGKPPSERNLRLIDLDVGATFPRGIAVHVETDFVAGGGSLQRDPDRGIYFGVLDLAFRGGLTMQAICLAATKNPDGTKGFSLVAILTFELANPWPLPMGFYLQGFGGMVAVHRTFDEVAMRAALPTGQLRNVLFPVDPVHHTAEIMAALETLFPVRRGSVIVGLLAKIGWASPTLVQFEIGLLYEFGRRRLIILGRVSAILPRTDLPIIKLNMDAVGILDREAGTFALDAVLYDSKLCDRFVITGAMAMRAAYKGSGGFALSVGGLHPKFNPPVGFPSVSRLQIALTDGDNPKLVCRAYFAITSNTVQFGADASLYAAAYGFSIHGDIGFDVLIQLLPLHFLAEFRASVQLKRGTRNLFKVSVAGELEGPLPLRVAGKASFEILWCDFSVKFNKTLADGGTPNDLLPIDVLTTLVAALSEPKAWTAQLPAGSSQLVTLRQPSTTGVLLHPLGTLTVRQNVVPLGLTRDIDRVGTGTPTGDRRFAITRAAIGDNEQTRDSIRELFAPGQFFDMSDDDKLAAPSFESMDAGVTFGDARHTAGPPQGSPFDFTDIVIGPDGKPVLEEPPVVVQGNVLDFILLSPVATSRIRRTSEGRFAAPVSATAPKVNAMGWAAVEEGVEPTEAALTWAEARGRAANRSWVLVPGSEVAR